MRARCGIENNNFELDDTRFLHLSLSHVGNTASVVQDSFKINHTIGFNTRGIKYTFKQNLLTHSLT